MQVLSRLVVILVLLGTLAYGSYAFGKYVLSSHLLSQSPIGDNRASRRSTRAAETVTRQTDYKGSSPRVEVKVLPAQSDGAGPAPPTRTSSSRRSSSRTSEAEADAAAERAVAQEASRAEALINNAGRSTSDSSPPRDISRSRDNDERRADRSTENRDRNSDENRSERRDTRRSDERREDREEVAAVIGSPLRGGGVYVEGSRTSGASGERTERRRKRRKRRVRSTTEGTQSSIPASENSSSPIPRAETRSESPVVISDSPVPRPESSGGGSPIPKPE